MNATLKSTNARLDTFEARFDRLEALLVAQFDAKAPAVTPAPKADPEPNEFVGWLRETAEARAERKATNKELAQALRKVGVNPAGKAWAYAKAQTAAGKAINTRTLKKHAAADKA